MDHVVADEHVQVLIPPDAGKRDTPRPGWQGGRYTAMRRALHERVRRQALPATKGDGRAGVRTDQAQPAHQPVPATRKIGRALRMAADHRHAQPAEAPQAPDSRRSGLKDGSSGNRAVQAAPTARVTHSSVAEFGATNVATATAARLCATPTTNSSRQRPRRTRARLSQEAVSQSRLRKPELQPLGQSLRGLAEPRLGRARLARATTCRFLNPPLERLK